eukprot:gene1825-14266_t
MNTSIHILAAALTAASLHSAFAQETIHAKCVFQETSNADGRIEGSITFVDNPVFGTYIEVDITAGKCSPGEHGVHVHSYGDVSSATGAATGPHYNPFEEEHGCYPGARKVGDMGNVIVSGQGDGKYIELENTLMRLRGESSVLGRGAIYHAGTDTCIRTPEGDASAGSRHAQCIIGRIKPDVDLEQRVLAAWRNKENARQLLGPAYKNATIVV